MGYDQHHPFSYAGQDIPEACARELTSLRREVAALRKLQDERTESDCDKVLAMTDEQIAALAAVQGSSAEIYALKGEVGILRARLAVAERKLKQVTQ